MCVRPHLNLPLLKSTRHTISDDKTSFLGIFALHILSLTREAL